MQKKSSLPSISDGNALYSLAGAEYGIYASRDDASTHNASKALETHVTNDQGAWKTERNLAPGTYYVAETDAPDGYAIDGNVYEVAVPAGGDAQVNGGSVSDVPQHETPSSWALKRDAETSDGKAQGSATLGGAQFEVRYFDGYYDAGSLPANATRTWVVKTDNSGVARVTDELKESGDDFYRDANGNVVIPLGTIAVQEIEAPSGYRLSDTGTYVATIKPDGSSPQSVTPFMVSTVSDYVQRGGVAVGKIDREYQQPVEQGSATLEHATFEIMSENQQPILVDGNEFRKGSAVMTISTSAEDLGFIARTAGDALPVGTYSIREISSSEGYLFDQASRDWRAMLTIDSDGQIADLGQGFIEPFHIIGEAPEKLLPAHGCAAVCIEGVIRVLEMCVDTVEIKLTQGRRAHIVIQHIAGDDSGCLDHAVFRDREILIIGDIIVIGKIKAGNCPDLGKIPGKKGTPLPGNDI